MAGFERFAASASRIEQKTNITENRRNCGGRNAFSVDDEVEFGIRSPSGTKKAEMILLSDQDRSVRTFEMDILSESCSLRLAMSRLSGTGLYFYKYRITTENGLFDVIKNKKDGTDMLTYSRDGLDGAFQLLVYRKRENYPEWMYGGIMYQIMPDRFFKAGHHPKKDYAVMQQPGETPEFAEIGEPILNNNFFGGDLEGIEAKLDYLESLGVNILYLNPIFDAYSNHKYDTGDYEHVDSMFGGDEALEHLLKECGKRNIHVILDGVFNHTGSDSRYFNKYGHYGKGGACQDESSEYHDWYNFEKYPDKYECWWGIDTLPRVRCDNEKYLDYICGENGIVRKYLRKGISGWRLDVADEVSDNFLKHLKNAALSEKKDAVIIGEVWEDASSKISYGNRRMYLEGEELDSVMNYPVMKAIVGYLRSGDYLKLLTTLRDIYGNYPEENANLLMNFLGTHDTERILTSLAGTPSDVKKKAELSVLSLSKEEYERGIRLLKIAYTMISTLPGVPCTFYGDEAGMEGYGDPFCRKYYPWGKENTELLDFYREMGRIRRNEPLFRKGTLDVRFADTDLACYERSDGENTVVVIVNRSENEYELRVSGAQNLFSEEYSDHFRIAPLSPAILKIRNRDSYLVTKKVSGEESK